MPRQTAPMGYNFDGWIVHVRWENDPCHPNVANRVYVVSEVWQKGFWFPRFFRIEVGEVSDGYKAKELVKSLAATRKALVGHEEFVERYNPDGSRHIPDYMIP